MVLRYILWAETFEEDHDERARQHYCRAGLRPERNCARAARQPPGAGNRAATTCSRGDGGALGWLRLPLLGRALYRPHHLYWERAPVLPILHLCTGGDGRSGAALAAYHWPRRSESDPPRRASRLGTGRMPWCCLEISSFSARSSGEAARTR